MLNAMWRHLPLNQQNLRFSTCSSCGPPKSESPQVLDHRSIPCRNERGNIRRRSAGSGVRTHQEILFVDGHSTDGTPDENTGVIRKTPKQDIKFFPSRCRQSRFAVRYGFAQAAGDILMILDADLTVPPEYLVRCYTPLRKTAANCL